MRGAGLRAEDLPYSLTAQQAADVMQLTSPRQIYELLPRGKIPGAQKIGAHWRVNRDVLLDWLRGNSAPHI